MRGDVKVIEQLNQALSAELTAIVEYMVQAEMCENWGYPRLAGLTKARAIQEMHHAEHLIERILFLDGKPAVDIPLTPRLGDGVQQQLEIGLEDETGAIKDYNQAAAICREAGDDGSRELFKSMIEDEEHHADFLESQLHAIKEMGLAAYLAQQVKKGE